MPTTILLRDNPWCVPSGPVYLEGSPTPEEAERDRRRTAAARAAWRPEPDAWALVERLRAPYPERLLRPVRKVLSTGTAKERVAALATLADDLGFTPTSKPQPLPPITEDDVHLLCWMAIAPATSPTQTITEQLSELPLGDKL